ncbi:MAG: hypothetical protein JWP44_365 [Mucilaginibacter sp.]|nr:hypothetical protein [Mucilaginibacter sp.]
MIALSEEEKQQQLITSIPVILKSGLQNTGTPLPIIANKKDFYEVTRSQKLLVEVAERCAIQELAENAPLVEREEMEEDLFSYLLEPYQELPAFTAVLKCQLIRRQ